MNTLLTLLLGPAGNICAPLTPQSCAESGPGPEMVQPVRPERRDGPNQGERGLPPLRGGGNVLVVGGQSSALFFLDCATVRVQTFPFISASESESAGLSVASKL